jgi:predicted metal-dependent hydrolase
MQNFSFNGLEVQYVCKPKLKNSYISVTRDGILLKTPRVSNLYIERLLKKKETWIRNKLSELNSKVYVDKYIEDEKKAKELLRSRVEYFSKKMQLQYSELKFRRMKRRWGGCSSKGVITLNTYLSNTPMVQIDYVVVHELAHLVYMDHSKKFHQLVAMYTPSSKTILQNFHLL